MQYALDNGMILRSLSEGYPSDRENLPLFNQRIHGEDDGDEPFTANWTNDFLAGIHPTVTPDDIWVIVDPHEQDHILSSLTLIPQTWRYEAITFGVGRIELCGTDETYRLRGLMRALMGAAHARCADLGLIAQGITGIRHFYRRFGYSMSLDLGVRGVIPLSLIPDFPPDRPPQYTLRPATAEDIPHLLAWDDFQVRKFLVTTVRTEQMWQYELVDGHQNKPYHHYTFIILNARGDDVGYVSLLTSLLNPICRAYVAGERTSYLDTFDDVVRGIRSIVHNLRPADAPPAQHLYFDVGMPEILDTLIGKMDPGSVRPTSTRYAWYMRVPDLPVFIRRVASSLERRLHGSGAHRYTGDLRITFFDQTGLTIRFYEGRITDVTHGPMGGDEGFADAGFPYYTFLDVLFGRRTPAEVSHILPESFATRKGAVLLDILFPARRSWVVPLA